MKVISQFVISIFELIEAEGRGLRTALRAEGRDLHTALRAEARDLRSVVVDLAIGIALLLAAMLLFMAGVGFMVVGLMWWLETHMPSSLAAVITGLVIFALGLVCLLLFRSLTKAKDS